MYSRDLWIFLKMWRKETYMSKHYKENPTSANIIRFSFKENI